MPEELNEYLAAEGPRYQVACEVAAHICNILARDYPGGKAELFGRVTFLLLDGMYEAERRLAGRLEPSSN